MQKEKIAVLIGSLQAAIASLSALLQLYETLRENWKIKGNTEIYSLPFNSKFNSQYFFQNLNQSHFLNLVVFKTFNTVSSNIY